MKTKPNQALNPARTLVAVLASVLLAGSASAAIETWSNLDGQQMQAEFLGRKGDYVSFKKEDGSRYLYPYDKLSEADRGRVDAHSASGVALPADEPAAPAPAAPPAKVGEIPAALSGKLVRIQGKKLAPAARDQLNGARYLAFYYSAHWCPPCRGFTPELVSAYKEIKAKHPEFDIVFVSSDRDADAMKGYMSEYGMEWPALRFDQIQTARVTRRPKNERGIPNLVFMDADGKELSLSYTPDGKYRGPRAVLSDIKKHFKM